MEATPAAGGRGIVAGDPSLLILSDYTGALVLALDEADILKQVEFFSRP